jgi:hypothetical protein
MLHDHAAIVMNEIDKAITELDNAEATHQKLLKLGECHKNRGLKEFFLWVNILSENNKNVFEFQ